MEVADLSIENKYRVHEVAKDFKLNSKDIANILTKYDKPPKNHMQVLDTRQLAIIFDYLTQHNQIDSIESVFSEVYHTPKKEQPQPQPQAAPAQPQARSQGQSAAQNGKAAAPAGQKSTQQPNTAPRPVSRVPEKKVVDTRKAGDVNLAKYDQRLEDLAPEKASRMKQGKEKFQNRSNRGRGQNFGNKRKQEEAEKMRRLQLEIAKKTPLTVKIPDEISVGELASRMKKTGAEVVKCLIKNGVMASLSQVIDFDTAAIIAEEMGCKVEKEDRKSVV